MEVLDGRIEHLCGNCARQAASHEQAVAAQAALGLSVSPSSDCRLASAVTTITTGGARPRFRPLEPKKPDKLRMIRNGRQHRLRSHGNDHWLP